MDIEINNKIDKCWSNKIKAGNRVNWWQSKKIISHNNLILCGKESPILGFGQRELIKKNFKLPFSSGISIGAGLCAKEIQLVKEGICSKFDIYELSEQRLEQAIKKVHDNNLDDQFNFFNEDYFCNPSKNTYDLFHWDNSLHHMLNADLAVKLSYDRLKPGGCFYCYDYIGQTYYQHTDDEMLLVNVIRNLLPEHLFESDNPQKKFKRFKSRPNLKKFINEDPSESADSSNILSSIIKYFPDAKIINLGGLVYHQVLVHILRNIPDDSELMANMLDLDIYLSNHDYNQYIFAFAKKK